MSHTPTPTPTNPRPAGDSHLSWNDLARTPSRRIKLPSRDDVVSALKTLAWVVPLTLLIWVYAEREQLTKEDRVVIPIDVKSSDPNRVVRLLKPDDKNIVATLEGPRAALDAVRDQLLARVPVEIDKNLAPGQIHSIPTEPTVAGRSSIFHQSGITVTNCQPEQLQVEVDEVVDRKVDVQLPPSVTNLASPPTFEPRQVSVRGPKSLIDRAIEDGRLNIFADLAAGDTLKTPGHHDLPAAPLVCTIHDDRIAISPETVHAILEVREADVRYEIPAMTIFVMGPTNVLSKYNVVFPNNNPSLPKVTVIGPPKTIEMMQRPDFAPKPKAWIEVSSDDAVNPKPKHIQYDLPEGVVPSSEDLKRTVDVKLVDRTAE